MYEEIKKQHKHKQDMADFALVLETSEVGLARICAANAARQHLQHAALGLGARHELDLEDACR